MTTFLQNLEPLLLAAEKYAETVKTYDNLENDYQEVSELIRVAKDNLCQAAIEFAKWGKK